jgi:hypothetical protein
MQSIAAADGAALRSTMSDPAEEQKKGGQAQSAASKALTFKYDDVAVTMSETARADEQPSAMSRASITLAALLGHEYSSSATPWSLLACTAGTPTSTVIVESAPTQGFAAPASVDAHATAHMSATIAACAAHVHAGM